MIKNKRLLLPAALAVASCLSSAALAQTTATWLAPTSGSWTDPTMWSTNPFYPTSDNPAGATYDALINAGGPAYTVQYSDAPAISLDALTLNSSSATVNLSNLNANAIAIDAGSLTAGGTFNIANTINLSGSGTFNLAGTLRGGTVSGPSGSFVVNEGAELSNIAVGLGFQASGVTLDGSVALQDVNITAVNPADGLHPAVSLNAGTTLGGTGQILLGGTIRMGGGSTIGSGISISATSGSADIQGSFNNQGTVLIGAGTSMKLDVDSFANAGSIQLNGGSLILGNGSSGAAVMPGDVNQNIIRNSGSVLLGGTYDFTGQQIDLTNTPLGPVDLQPISITGGTFTAPGRTMNLSSNGSSSLNAVTFASDVAATGNFKIGSAGLILQGATLDFRGGNIDFGGSTLSGNGSVVFNAPNGVLTSVNIAPNVTVRTGTSGGTLGATAAGTNLSINNGTISSAVAGKWIGIAGTGFVNNGTVQAVNGGGIALVSPFTNNATITASNSNIELFGQTYSSALSSMAMTNSNLIISGVLFNNGNNLVVQDSHRNVQITPTGYITDGTISAPNGGVLAFVPSPSGLNLNPRSYAGGIMGVTLLTPILVESGAGANLGSVDFQYPVTVNAGGGVTLSYLTNDSTIITTGGTIQIYGGVNNRGTIEATQGAQILLYAYPSSLGTLSLSDSTLFLGSDFSASQVSAIQRTNSPVILGNMNLAGQVLTLDRAPEWYLSEAIIQGGTIVASNSTPLYSGSPVYIPYGGSLIGVTMRGPIVVPYSGNLYIQSGMTMANAKITLNGGYNQYGISSDVDIYDSTLSGSGEIEFDEARSVVPPQSCLQASYGSDAAVIGSGIYIHTGSGDGVLAGNFISSGTVEASNSRTIYIHDDFQNNGVLRAAGGMVLVTGNLQNLVNGSLNGGTYEVENYSNLFLEPSYRLATITTNNATILLSGPFSLFEALKPLVSNLGQLSIRDGRVFKTAGDLSNVGTLSVDNQSLLSVAGNLSLGDQSVLDLTLGAGNGKLLQVQGSLALDGQLDIELANGFLPTNGERFQFMTAGTFNGNFTSFDLPSLPGSEVWDTSQASAGIISVTPEPSMLAIAGLLSASLLLRRRR